MAFAASGGPAERYTSSADKPIVRVEHSRRDRSRDSEKVLIQEDCYSDVHEDYKTVVGVDFGRREG